MESKPASPDRRSLSELILGMRAEAQRGGLAAGVPLAMELLALKPDNLEALLLVARARTEQGAWSEARKAWNKVLAVPGAGERHYLFAIRFAEAAGVADAIEEYALAGLALFPANLVFRASATKAAIERGNPDAAIDHFAGYVPKDRDEVLNLIASALARGNFLLATCAFVAFKGHYPDDPEVANCKARLTEHAHQAFHSDGAAGERGAAVRLLWRDEPETLRDFLAQGSAFLRESNPHVILDDLTLEESGRFETGSGDIVLCRYPYPYIAALAISNNTQYLSRAGFDDLYETVNGGGEGDQRGRLQLEIGCGVDLFADPEVPSVAIFAGDGSAVGGNARVHELAAAGWIDSVHCDTARPDVATALDAARGLGIAPAICIEREPVLARASRRLTGLSDETVVEKFAALGTRYFTSSAFTVADRFGDHIDYRTVQNLRTVQTRYDWNRWLEPNMADRSLRGFLRALFNDTVVDLAQPGAKPFLVFKRTRAGVPPSQPNFPFQLTSQRLDVLEHGGGAAIVETQLGMHALIGRARDRRRALTPPVLDEHCRLALRELSDRNAAGRIFVTTTSRLLDYLRMRATARWSVERADNRWTIAVEAEAPSWEGLSFIVPPEAPQVVLRTERTLLPVRRIHDARKKRDVVLVPWHRLVWPSP